MADDLKSTIEKIIKSSKNAEDATQKVILQKKAYNAANPNNTVKTELTYEENQLIAEKHLKTNGNVQKSLTDSISSAFIDTKSNESGRVKFSDFTKGISDISSVFKNAQGITGLITGLVTTIASKGGSLLIDLARNQTDLIGQIKGSTGYIGEFGDDMVEMVSSTLAASQAIGVSSREVINGFGKMVENSGKVTLYSKQTIEEGVKASAAFMRSNTDLLENAEKYRDVGISLYDASKSITDIGMKSVNLGLNAKKVTQTITENVTLLNAVGFKNGIEGLSKMVQQAQALNFDFNKTIDLADKLFDPSAAIDMTARLQAIGGAMGNLNDPLRMMYDATNNVEDLQTSILGAAKSLATYNTEQGRFEVTGINLRRAKEMSQALGISMNDLTSAAIKGSVRMEAMSKINMFPNLKEDQKEFVANLSTMKDGKVGFDIPEGIAKRIFGDNAEGGFRSMEEMGGNMDKFIDIQQKIAKEKPEDIARDQYNETTKTNNILTAIWLEGQNRARYSEIGRGGVKLQRTGTQFITKIADKDKYKAEDVGKDVVVEGAKGLYHKILETIGIENNNTTIQKQTAGKITSGIENNNTTIQKQTAGKITSMENLGKEQTNTNNNKNTNNTTPQNEQTKVHIEIRNLDPNTKLTERNSARSYTNQPVTIVGAK